MCEKRGLLSRLRITVLALLPEQWRGEAGLRFRTTVNAVSEFTKEHIRPSERIQEAPDVLWDTIRERSSRTGVNLADEEQKRIASELARRTLEDKVRQEKATADRLEAEANIAKIQQQQAMLEYIERLKKVGVVPVWDKEGPMMFIKAPLEYDWDSLANSLLRLSELQLGPAPGSPPNSTETEGK